MNYAKSFQYAYGLSSVLNAYHLILKMSDMDRATELLSKVLLENQCNITLFYC